MSTARAFKDQRHRMVDRQIAARGITDERLLAAMREIPRERFVPEALAAFAYEDCALPIDENQTISQPYIVALMLELGAIRETDRVLEIGAGSGYAAAVISRLAARVYGIERHRTLADKAAKRLARLGYDNVEIIAGDGSKGLAAHAPFDVVIVSAGGPRVPAALRDQLAIGGRLIMPVGQVGAQQLVRVTRHAQDHFGEEVHGRVAFVPLIGADGWPGDAADPASDSVDDGGGGGNPGRTEWLGPPTF